MGSKLDDFLRHLGMAEQIDQQLGFGEPSVGRENSSVELTGALIGGSLTAGSLYEFMRLTAYAISQDNSPIEKLAHGFMGMLLAESSFTTIAAIGVFAGRELAAPFANHQTREGIKHFLEIEHVIPKNNQPF